jgi:hypothetical protein
MWHATLGPERTRLHLSEFEFVFGHVENSLAVKREDNSANSSLILSSLVSFLYHLQMIPRQVHRQRRRRSQAASWNPLVWSFGVLFLLLVLCPALVSAEESKSEYGTVIGIGMYSYFYP